MKGNVLSVNQPKDIRVRYGLEERGQIIVEETDDGILLRPAITFPIESYSDERVKEFKNNNEKALAAFKLP